MAKPIIFGTFQFRTKKAATEEIRARINAYEAKEVLNDKDQLFFEELFKLHDEYEQKIGVGVKHIQVERDFHKNRCLYIHRNDGSRVDISWVHCVRPASIKSTISMAFRRAVKEIITNFKTQMLSEGATCPKSNIQLNFKNSHVSYIEPSFDKLFNDFLILNGKTCEMIELENPKPQDTDQRGMIKEPKIKALWVKYHHDNASIE